MRRAVAPVAALAWLAGACETSAGPTVGPCVTSLKSDAAYDLVLEGAQGCPGTARFALRVATGDPAAPAWATAASAPVKVEGAWQATPQGATRAIVLHNTSAAPVDVVGLEWTAEGLDALAIDKGRMDRALHQGYQSWSYTGVEDIPTSVPDKLGTAAHGDDDEDTLGEIPGVSWWAGALSDAQGRGLVAAADGATVFKTYAAADNARLRVVMGVTGDAITLAPGESRAIDGLFVRRGDVAESLEQWAALVAQKHGAPAIASRRKPLGGWGSWNLYYEKITSATLDPEAAWAQQKLVPLGMKDFLTDDGYEPRWGAWSAKQDFGADLATFASSQVARGMTPAIWLAPIYVDTSDASIVQHPDWFVRNADDSPRLFTQFDGTKKAALDVTNDAARAFATDQLAQLWAWGFRTFKLDFLFGAGIAGKRQKKVTGMESYALWMKAIRAAAPDAHLVGCGAPILPSVGTFDSMRTGADIAFASSPVPTYAFLADEAKSTILRAFTDAWWSLDPDVVLLRDTRIGDAEAWTTVVASALSGGNYLLGDGRQAGDVRVAMALDPEVLAMTRDGRAARAIGGYSETDPKIIPSPVLAGNGEMAIPHVWKKTSADGARAWTAVFAWLSDAFDVEVTLGDAAFEITPPTQAGPATRRAVASGKQHVTVPPRSVRLFVSR